MSAPAVTVLLPTYNAGAMLAPSVKSVLRQTLSSFELLVIDDGSTDQTAEFLRAVRDERLRVLTNEGNLGQTRSLNRGLAEARGEFVARQDADDLCAPTRLEKQLVFLRAEPAVQLLGTCGWRLNPSGRITGSNDMPMTHDAIRWASVTDNPFLHTSVMFRRNRVLSEFGGYDESFAICQDYDLWTRIAARHRVANLGERLVCMREHPSSMTRRQAEATSAEMRRILEPNCADLFPNRTFSNDERDLLCSFRLRFGPELLPQLRAFLDMLLAEFLARYPRAQASADFRATLCRQSLRLAYKFLRVAPTVAFGQIVRAFQESPGEWFAQGWRSLAGLTRLKGGAS